MQQARDQRSMEGEANDESLEGSQSFSFKPRIEALNGIVEDLIQNIECSHTYWICRPSHLHRYICHSHLPTLNCFAATGLEA
jgi:hypothetical protein